MEKKIYAQFLVIWHSPTGSCIHGTDEQLEKIIWVRGRSVTKPCLEELVSIRICSQRFVLGSALQASLVTDKVQCVQSMMQFKTCHRRCALDRNKGWIVESIAFCHDYSALGEFQHVSEDHSRPFIIQTFIHNLCVTQKRFIAFLCLPLYLFV